MDTDPIAQDWYDADWEEPAEIAFLRACALRRGKGGLIPGAAIFDLGAHQGVIAMILGHHVGPQGMVLALEANARNADLAVKNISANHLSGQVSVCRAAAGPRDGETIFNNGFNGQVSAIKSVASSTVPMRAVDALAQEFKFPDVVYIDVEGFELEVLQEAAETLARLCTDFFIEMHSSEDMGRFDATAEKIIAHFPQTQFDLYALDPEAKSKKKFQPLGKCAALIQSGRRFYLVATWK